MQVLRALKGKMPSQQGTAGKHRRVQQEQTEQSAITLRPGGWLVTRHG